MIPAGQVAEVLTGRERDVMGVVEATYLAHGAGDTVCPNSSFLTFPDRPTSRIIALPASVGGGRSVDGVKWISSFPSNHDIGIPRANAVIVLNESATGRPFACLEGSVISAVRTAASAALGADVLARNRGVALPTRVGFVGTGVIASYIETYLRASGWRFERIGAFDLVPERARAFLDRVADEDTTTVFDSAAELITGSDLVVFATVAGTPHVVDPQLFAHNPLVLHISLRDLSPDVILSSVNVIDDVDHCFRADTSVHLAEQVTGRRDFVAASLYELLARDVELPADRPVVLSPFGMGILDIAVANHVYGEIASRGALATVQDFFPDSRHHGGGRTDARR
jgi:ornithine cyclodeaminase